MIMMQTLLLSTKAKEKGMKIQIDSNIEIPYRYSGSRNPFKEPLQSMEVNDSIRYEVKDDSQVRSAINTQKQVTSSREYITRKLDDQFRRVWRVK